VNIQDTPQKSKRLLELAKQAVEIAIEKGEKVGMKVLDSRFNILT